MMIKRFARARTRNLMTFLVLAMLALTPSCSGCSQETPEQTVERVRAALAAAGYDGIRVDMQNGELVLSGSVESEADLERIAGIIDGLEGLPDQRLAINVVPPEPEPTEEERAAAAAAQACREAMAGALGTPVLFATSSAALDADDRAILDRVATAAGSCDSVNLTVAGHADPRGTDEYNQGLSERRANAVKTYLEGKGVSGSAITANGYGESRSLGGELAADRRVELTQGS